MRKNVREILNDFLSEAVLPKFFIKFSAKKKTFVLYKRFYGYDEYDNKNEQIAAVQDLSTDQEQAQEEAKIITGQDLIAKPPSDPKTLNKSEMILPFPAFKGKKLKEIPLEDLIRFMFGFNNKWMNLVNKDPYRTTVYEYLTQDLRVQTEEYLKKSVRGTSTPELIGKYKEYIEKENLPGRERIVFSKIMVPLLKVELEQRRAYDFSDVHV